jgi:cytochrome c oxidase subunit 4
MNERRIIAAAWAALLVLLGATTAGAYLPLGSWNLPLALTIAGAKAAIVLVLFMRLRRGPLLARGFAVAGFFWLAILLWLALGDYVTRA